MAFHTENQKIAEMLMAHPRNDFSIVNDDGFNLLHKAAMVGLDLYVAIYIFAFAFCTYTFFLSWVDIVVFCKTLNGRSRLYSFFYLFYYNKYQLLKTVKIKRNITRNINQQDLKTVNLHFIKSENFHPPEVVDRVSETHIRADENYN